MFSCNNCKHLLWNEIFPLKIHILNSQSLVPQNVTILGDRHSKKWFHWNEVDRVVPLSNMIDVFIRREKYQECSGTEKRPCEDRETGRPSASQEERSHKTTNLQFSSVQSLSRVRLFATPWLIARQASLSITNSRSSLKLKSIESVMPSSHLILCCPLLLLSPIPPSIRVFSNESTLRMRWPKYWSFSFSNKTLDTCYYTWEVHLWHWIQSHSFKLDLWISMAIIKSSFAPVNVL